MRVKNLEASIVKKLIDFRKSLNLSQRQFALRADIDPPHLNKIEQGIMSASLTNLQKISEAYSIPLRYFFEFSETKEPQLHKQLIPLTRSINEDWKLKILIALTREVKSLKL